MVKQKDTITLPKNAPITLKQCQNPWVFLASGFCSGCSKYAPGTMGSLVAVPLIYAVSQLEITVYIMLTIAINVVGVLICAKAANALKVHDHGGIVWDEIGGMFITLILVPITITNLIIGFALFRFFDILKPYPISWLDKNIDGGLGIMIDDVLAGIFAALCLWAINIYFL